MSALTIDEADRRRRGAWPGQTRPWEDRPNLVVIDGRQAPGDTPGVSGAPAQRTICVPEGRCGIASTR